MGSPARPVEWADSTQDRFPFGPAAGGSDG